MRGRPITLWASVALMLAALIVGPPMCERVEVWTGKHLFHLDRRDAVYPARTMQAVIEEALAAQAATQPTTAPATAPAD